MLTSIVLVAMSSLFLKIAPQLLPLPANPESRISRGLDLTTCAMTGQIIMDTAVGGKSMSELIANFGVYDGAALLAAAGAYLTSRISGSLIKGLSAGLIVFLVTVEIFL
jgi:hypothetical protein